MIEQVLFFALGFLTMGMLGLLFLPFYWQRAVRLSTRRLQAQMPLTMAEVLAERDSLRAEFAVEKRRVEQQMEAARLASAQAQITLGQRAAQISQLTDDFSRQQAQSEQLRQQLNVAERARHEAEAGLGAANVEIHDANALTANSRNEFADLHAAHLDLKLLADSQRATIAALETRTASLEIRLADASQAIDQAYTVREANREEARALRADLAEAGGRLRDLDKRYANVVQAEALLAARSLALQAEVAGLRDQLDQSSAALASESGRLAARQTSLDEALRREKDLRASLQRQMDMARASDGSLAKRVETLRSENAGLLVQMTALQAELIEANRQASTGNRDSNADWMREDEVAQLRSAITDVGQQMIAFSRALQREGEAAGAPPVVKLRELQSPLASEALIN